jgi:hypothetical protein
LLTDTLTVSNTGTCLYMTWLAIACLNQFINSIIWNRNTVNRAPIWCDICEAFSCCTSSWLCSDHRHEASRIIIGSSVAITAVPICIFCQLYQVTSLRVHSFETEVSSKFNTCPRSAMLNTFGRIGAQSRSTSLSGWVFLC